ncbi:MAG: VWA domain-containing protein [Verrucomicrobiae bacterium]|nr:VWA domain-containing protein [Verrucomicrobiae bacterium]
MKTTTLILTIALAGSLACCASARSAPEKERPIDLVICLDTSNSMDGLINAAKQKLWDIVNELAKAKPKPHLRVALYAYGTPAFGAETGYVRKQIDLTDDLDAVYAKLTALVTDGGEEYVARVVRASVLEQPWSGEKDALKIIVVAGNEPATQDRQFKTADVCKDAITRGIIVNAIYCGPPTSPEADGWRDVARAADGQFACIDQDRGTIVVSTPFDQKLAALGGEINRTYLPYGSRASEGKALQGAADMSAMAASPAVFASRAVAKASGQYRNASWDLVDAMGRKDFDLAKVRKEELPADMQAMTLDQRRAHLDAMAKKRASLQRQIIQLSAQRQKFIDDELKRNGKSDDKAFDAAMLRAIREQATRKNFEFEKLAR